MAKEIEILYPLKTSVSDALREMKEFIDLGSNQVVDVYYFDPLRDQLKQRADGKIYECLRLRSKDSKFELAYKFDHYDGETWSYSDEHEISISSFEEADLIFQKIGLQKLVTVDNTKHKFADNDGKFEIVIEEVVDLGGFIEVEWQCEDDADIDAIKEEIRQFVQALGLEIGEELNSGKPELLLNRQQ